MPDHVAAGSTGTVWLDLAAVAVMFGGMSLLLWSSLPVCGWVLLGIGVARFALILGFRRWRPSWRRQRVK